MILDATAGNRAIWETKHSEAIIYIDIEKKLERKPTIFADNTCTPFRSHVFDTIIYDPPYYWGDDKSWYSIPDAKTYYALFGEKRKAPRYYGTDKMTSRGAVIAHIYRAQTEFLRILKLDGLLWMKWCEVAIRLHKVLAIFTNWDLLLKVYVKDRNQTRSQCQTYWLNFSPHITTEILTPYLNQKLLEEREKQ